MTSWAINGSDEEYSDMDGLGNPFVDNDDFSCVNGSVRADQNGKAGANCSVGDGGIFYVDPGVNALFNNLGAFTLTITEGGRFYPIGTNGNNAVIGGDVGQDANQISISGGGYMFGNYVTIQYLSNAVGIYNTTGMLHLKDFTISHFSTNSIRTRLGGYTSVDTGTWGDSDSTNSLMLSDNSEIYIKDCTMKATTSWLAEGGGEKAMVHLYGTNTIDIGGGAVEPDNTNDGAGAYVEDYRYYSSSTDNETNSVEDAHLSITHDSITVDGTIINSTNHKEYDMFLPYPFTDVSGNIVTYKLKKAFFDGAWFYVSDVGQAEAADNQKYTGKLNKDGYSTESDTEWAGVNMSFTLVADSGVTQLVNGGLVS